MRRERLGFRDRALYAPALCVCACALLLSALPASAQEDILFDVTDEEYYQMPALFSLDDYPSCVALGGAYCLGSFELSAPPGHQLFRFMQRFSADWDHFNHTRLHRGLCLPRSCAHVTPNDVTDTSLHVGNVTHEHDHSTLVDWFSACVNASMSSAYNLSARLRALEHCTLGAPAQPPPGAAERAAAALLAALLALAAVATVLDLTMNEHARKRCSWLLAWSLPGCWQALHAPVGGGGSSTAGAVAGRSPRTDLRALDGLRVMCMMCVIVEHVCWLATQSYLANTRQYELMRRAPDVMLMINSTLVVQIFFLMSSFLLAHKLLQQQRRPEQQQSSDLATFADTMFNRIVRISPSYFLVVWLAATWWSRGGGGGGGGPMWGSVTAEADVCRRKWWAHLLYLNNIVYADDKCLIQTWYLAADMQLYALMLALTLLLRRWRKGALWALTALLVSTVALLAGLAYAWRLVPTFVMHRPELVRESYRGEASFNVLYQSPLSNLPGALAGLLLAHAHHSLRDAGVDLSQSRVFRWISVGSPPLAVLWAGLSPLLLGRGVPNRAGAAALAALERPVFSLFVALGLLGAMHDVQSPLRRLLSWRGWRTPARLSFGALLLHLPLDKARQASRVVAPQLTRQDAIFDWFGVALVAYTCALPLALLVELPAQRLHRALQAGQGPKSKPPPPSAAAAAAREKTDM